MLRTPIKGEAVELEDRMLMYMMVELVLLSVVLFFFFQAEDGIRDLVRSRGLGDVYKRQAPRRHQNCRAARQTRQPTAWKINPQTGQTVVCYCRSRKSL